MPIIADSTTQPTTVDEDDENDAPSRVRARAQARAETRLREVTQKEPAVRRVLKAAARLGDRISDMDRETAKDVVVGAMQATSRTYSNERRAFDEFPDHKTRLAAAALLLAYDEGLPVKREISITSSFVSAEELLARMRQSPEALRRFPELAEPKTIGMDVQETG